MSVHSCGGARAILVVAVVVCLQAAPASAADVTLRQIDAFLRGFLATAIVFSHDEAMARDDETGLALFLRGIPFDSDRVVCFIAGQNGLALGLAEISRSAKTVGISPADVRNRFDESIGKLLKHDPPPDDGAKPISAFVRQQLSIAEATGDPTGCEAGEKPKQLQLQGLE